MGFRVHIRVYSLLREKDKWSLAMDENERFLRITVPVCRSKYSYDFDDGAHEYDEYPLQSSMTQAALLFFNHTSAWSTALAFLLPLRSVPQRSLDKSAALCTNLKMLPCYTGTPKGSQLFDHLGNIPVMLKMHHFLRLRYQNSRGTIK